MLRERVSGILLHPTSLPGPDGIGDLGDASLAWIDWLSSTGCALWQLLPLGPTGYGDSPYQSFSSFAGNPWLIGLRELERMGLLALEEFADAPAGSDERIDFGPLIEWKTSVLDTAHERFTPTEEYLAFLASESAWLPDFALFMALKEEMGGRPWNEWPPGLRDRRPSDLTNARQRLEHRVDAHQFRQFVFHQQWGRVRTYAAERGIRIVGDLPIFVAHDSCDVWAAPELFRLDPTGLPEVVAGVPPDYFSATGQLWGNPLYRWERHAADGYAWWMARLDAILRQVDVVRIDHFRAFADYWEIPGDAPTAEDGKWRDGPGAAFFDVVRATFGDLPIIAEDLGELSPAVFRLRDQFELPGMRILQFAFDSDETNPFLPHNYPANCVAYTGTHDNDTTVGWYASADPDEQHKARSYLGVDGSDIAWSLIQAVWESPASFALAPMQDILSLPTEARMNLPGTSGGNWHWRMLPGSASSEVAERVSHLNNRTGRTATP